MRYVQERLGESCGPRIKTRHRMPAEGKCNVHAICGLDEIVVSLAEKKEPRKPQKEVRGMREGAVSEIIP